MMLALALSFVLTAAPALPIVCTGAKGVESYRLSLYAEGDLIQAKCEVTAGGKVASSINGRPKSEPSSSVLCVVLNSGQAKGVDKWRFGASDGRKATLWRVRGTKEETVTLTCSRPGGPTS